MPPDATADFGPTVRGMRAVADAFAGAGHVLYLVGGIVRDTLLGIDARSPDVDATTSAPPPVIKELLAPLASALWTQGERFGTIGARIGAYDVEITTFRAEDYDPSSRKPDVAFSDDLRSDLARRDFTINAMAVSLIDGTVHDPFGGADDLAAKRLRTPLDPVVSFSDDPLRMLRAARFIARMDLETDPDLLAAARSLAGRLDIVSRERIHDELERLLAVEAPRRGLEFLAEVDLLAKVLGFEPEPLAVDQSFRLVDELDGVARRRIGLLFPHGPQATEAVVRRLRYSTADTLHTVRAVTLLAALEQRPASAVGARALVADARNDLDLVADILAVGSAIEHLGAHVDDLTAALETLAGSEELAPTRPPLDGARIMAEFDLEPGPQVGRAVAYLQQRRIERGPMTDDQAVAELRAWGELTPHPGAS